MERSGAVAIASKMFSIHKLDIAHFRLISEQGREYVDKWQGIYTSLATQRVRVFYGRKNWQAEFSIEKMWFPQFSIKEAVLDQTPLQAKRGVLTSDSSWSQFCGA